MKSIFNRAPLTPNTMAPLSLGSIQPEGWLREQLETQASGLSGKLYEIWPDVSADCAWLGGTGDGWERAPYYLDGLVPLAWTLEDDTLKALAMKYIEWILASQQESGWFGPEKNTDHWPLIIAMKALRSYFSATGDKRVLVLMDRFFKYQYHTLDTHPLKEWACARGGDEIELVLWMYNITGQKYLLELCKKLRAQTLDWVNVFSTFPNMQPMAKSMPWKRQQEAMQEEEGVLEGTNHPYFHTYYHQSHVVNVAMGLKMPGVVNMFKSGFKEQTGFKTGWQKLMKQHGVAYGMFTGDEHINGASPTQGTELCAVAETMYSLETLLGVGDFGKELPDILEKIAFNALPAAFTADMMGHQYDQQANQVKVSREERPWYNNGPDSNLFGLEPNFGCCTANFHQAWPKFVESLWYATSDNGLAVISYAPCTIRARVDGVPVRIKVSGEYPFGQNVTIEVSCKQPVTFPMYLRVPFWAKQPCIYLPEGEIMQVHADETTCIRRKWIAGDVVRVEMPMEPRITRWYHQSAAVELGPLLMAYQPREKWEKLGGNAAAPDWAVTAESDWNWALLRDEPMKAVFDSNPRHAFKHGQPTVRVLVKAARVPDWGMDGANCGQTPIEPKLDLEHIETVELVPYGDTSLRISQFPLSELK